MFLVVASSPNAEEYNSTNSQKKNWKEKWSRNTTLQSNFPTIFSIASNSDTIISQNRKNNARAPLFKIEFPRPGTR